ncbi:hypothetical protein FRB95_009383 [Tulasnella sp. JGI-2019a]|nr:hypothetical protein FRB95_009383 [Tulasnella sp. JGI-2019a]
MPFDPSVHLASQGWGGHGQPLRPNSNGLRKPIVVAQKKTLGGVGKDRDVSFAFWDHVYAASAQAITVKIYSDLDTNEDSAVGKGEEGEFGPSPNPLLSRTQTGILSNRPPSIGDPILTPTSSQGDYTPPIASPDNDEHGSNCLRRPLSLLSLAKKEAAKRGLYARFFRGPIVGLTPDPEVIEPTLSIPDSNITSPETEDGDVQESGKSSAADDGITLDGEALLASRAAKAARKAERAAKRLRKAEKKLRRLEAAHRAAATIGTGDVLPGVRRDSQDGPKAQASSSSSSKKRKAADTDSPLVDIDTGAQGQKGKKRKHRHGEDRTGEVHGPAEDEERKARRRDQKAKRKAGRLKDRGQMIPQNQKKVKFAETVKQVIVSRWQPQQLQRQ